MDRWEVERALRKSGLPSNARLVLHELLTRVDAGALVIPTAFSPSLSRLAHDTGLSRSTVAVALNLLERDQWVLRIRDLERARSRKQPTRYRLQVPPRRSESLGAEGAQSHTATSPGGGLVREADQSTSPGGGPELVREPDRTSPGAGHNQTSTRPKPEQQRVPAARRPADPYAAAGFAEFWSIYPRKVEKRAAAKAYAAALKRGANAADILAGILASAPKLVAHADGKPRFIPHPAKWLNGDRWDDEPGQQEPQRPGRDDPDEWSEWQ